MSKVFILSLSLLTFSFYSEAMECKVGEWTRKKGKTLQAEARILRENGIRAYFAGRKLRVQIIEDPEFFRYMNASDFIKKPFYCNEKVQKAIAHSIFMRVELLDHLLKNGLDPNMSFENDTHCTLLLECIREGRAEAVKSLLEAGARIDVPVEGGRDRFATFFQDDPDKPLYPIELSEKLVEVAEKGNEALKGIKDFSEKRNLLIAEWWAEMLEKRRHIHALLVAKKAQLEKEQEV